MLSQGFFQKLLDTFADRMFWVGAYQDETLISSSIFSMTALISIIGRM
ncbi:hypothetical protein ACSE3M_06670 [Bacillus velezensis]